MIEHLGATQAESILRGIVANMARAPKGGDTDQIRAVASGECAIALTNTYYLARLMRSDKPEDRSVVDRIGVVFPNQGSFGTHINCRRGRAHAKNLDAAQLFLHLAGGAAQRHFGNGRRMAGSAIVEDGEPGTRRDGAVQG
jgi:iron(III) transport system substrate-binding protein